MQAEIVNELTFYLSNQAGMLANITKTFSETDVSIKGLLVSEGFGKSVVRVVVDDEEKALAILEGMGLGEVTRTPVLAIRMPSKIGVLAELSAKMGKSGVNMDNIYVTESTQGDTIAYVSVEEVEEGLKVFQ